MNTDQNTLKKWLQLTLTPGIGPRTFHRLIEHCSSNPEVILEMSSSQLSALGINLPTSRAMQKPKTSVIGACLEWQSRDSRHHIITIQSEHYPERLKQIPDAPPLLFIKGQLKALQRQPCIAFVGARKCTRLGENNCYQLSLQCANLGFVIVSGLAYGIDSHAHRACLNSNSASPTLAVLANGLDKIYPPQHQAMAEQILSEGALISEYIPGTQPLPQHFPQRNRIISGLCIAVVVIEAARKSGSLITARLSMEQGREVFCVPGPINNPLNQGGHDLIQQGAKLITCTEDILEEFTEYTHLANPQKTTMKQSENIAKYPDRLLELFDYTPISVDELIKKSGLTPEKVSSMLVTLEMAGRVICDINGLYSRSTTDGK